MSKLSQSMQSSIYFIIPPIAKYKKRASTVHPIHFFIMYALIGKNKQKDMKRPATHMYKLNWYEWASNKYAYKIGQAFLPSKCV